MPAIEEALFSPSAMTTTAYGLLGIAVLILFIFFFITDYTIRRSMSTWWAHIANYMRQHGWFN